MANDYCRNYTYYLADELADDKICAGLPDSHLTSLNENGFHVTQGGKGVCNKDGGSPLVCDVNGVLAMMGVVSGGYECGTEGFPGIYTSVHYHQEWIRETIAALEDRK